MTDSILERFYFEKSFGLRTDNKEDNGNEKEHFDLLCTNKIYEGEPSPAEMLLRTKFINVTDRINIRHPFLVLQEFVEDFFDGEYSKNLVTRYHILDYVELNYTLENILKLSGARFKKNIDEARNKNLLNKKWSTVYDFILKNSQYFRKEQLYLVNYNRLRGLIVIHLYTESGKTTMQHLIDNIQSIFEEVNDRIHLLKLDNIRNSFSEFTRGDFGPVINDIVKSLEKQGILANTTDDILNLNSNYKDVTSTIVSVLTNYPNGISYDSFYRKIEKENPPLELVPRTGIIESTLAKLENSGQIFRIHGYWRYQPYKDTLILSANLEKKAKEIKADLERHGATAFFGRKIKPENFVDELLEIHKGDFNDSDDQVTRIAGLFLPLSSDIAIMRDSIPIFDFLIKLPMNYKHIKLIDQSDTTVSKYHILVKIDSPIDEQLARRIRQNLPEREKAIVATLKEVDVNIKESLLEDRVIIFGYEELISLVRKVGKLPSRVNSIAKIMYGSSANAIVTINSIDYETRVAAVTVVPTNEFLTVGLGSLHEIWLGNSNDIDLEVYSANYQQFLSILSKHSEPSLLKKGLINPNIESAKYTVKYTATLQETPKYLEGYIDPYDERQVFLSRTSVASQNLSEFRLTWQVKVDGYTIKIHYESNTEHRTKGYHNANVIIRQVFHCSCMYWDGITHSFPLCSHLISALDLMVKKIDCLNKTWMNEDMNIVTNLLHQFVKLNDWSIVEALVIYIQDSHVPKLVTYIENLSCLDKKIENSFLSLKKHLREEILNSVDATADVESLFLKMEEAISRMKKSEVEILLKNLK
jgi:hypothetical protein